MQTPLQLPDPHPFAHQPKYQHLSFHESLIWDEFIRTNSQAFENVFYDVPVGVIPNDPRGVSTAASRRMIRQSCSKRIDVVGQKARQLYVIEIKPRASYTAFGQALVYTACLNNTYKPDPAALPAILTEHLDQDIAQPCTAHKIRIFYPRTNP